MTSRPRILASGGVIGPVAFVAAWSVAGAVGGFSFVDDAISDLAAVGASTRIAMTIGFVLFGVGLIAFGLALRVVLDGPAWIAAVVTGTATLGVAATPLGGWSGDGAHAACAGVGYASLAALPLLAARTMWRVGFRIWAIASVLAGVVAAVLLAASTLGPAHGLWQRLGLTVGDIWIVVVAVGIVATEGGVRRVRRGRVSAR